MFARIWSWLLGVAARVRDAFRPYLMTEAALFVAEALPIARDAVENALNLDLDGDGKRRHAQDEIMHRLEALGRAYSERWVNQAIEIAYELIRAELDAAGGSE